MESDLVGMLADGNLGNRAKIVGIQRQNGSPGPVGDIQLRAVAGQGHIIRTIPGRGSLNRLAAYQIKGGDGAGGNVQRVKEVLLRVEGKSTLESLHPARFALLRWLWLGRASAG